MPGVKQAFLSTRTRRLLLNPPRGMITREREPVNLEMPFANLDGFITANENFYVRCHFPIPSVDPQTWRLKVSGAVDREVEFSYDELRKLKSRTLTVTIECAGNSRVFLVPKVKGVQWELGAVGNAEWTGVLLSELLRTAGLKENAREVILEGADKGMASEAPHPDGRIHFARSLPLKKAVDDVLLAYQMNGDLLPPSHGFPLRAVVPGWYGMASVKWLHRIIVTDRPFFGYYQTVDYAFWERGDNGPSLTPLSRMRAKAEISRPAVNGIVPANDNYIVEGAAWTGESEITGVEVSTDGGRTWDEATLLGDSLANAWRLWQFEWRTPEKPGRCTLMARATDASGATQPAGREPNRGHYMIDHWLPVDVDIRR